MDWDGRWRGPRRSPGLLSIVRVLRSTRTAILSPVCIWMPPLSLPPGHSVSLSHTPAIIELSLHLTRERHFQRFTCFSLVYALLFSFFFFFLSFSFFFLSFLAGGPAGKVATSRFPLYASIIEPSDFHSVNFANPLVLGDRPIDFC